MNKGTIVLALVLVGGLALVITVIELIGRQQQGSSPIGTVIRTALSSERIMTPEEKAAKSAAPPAPAAPKKPAAAKPKPAAPTVKPSTSAKPKPSAEKPAATPPAAASPPVAAPPRPSGLSVGVSQRRLETFVAGNRQDWTGFDIFFDRPLMVRAGGAVRSGDLLSGPAGVPAPPTPGVVRRDVRVMPDAPHLALIGRVCSSETCTPPFVVGARTLLCPSKLGVAGELQFWTNNYVQVDGYQTLRSFTDVAGGYRFEVEPAEDEACDAPPSSAPPRSYAEALDRGEVITSPSFTVSARQNAWKPFFLPVDRPLHIRARGEMSPYERTKPTGPDGIVVPDGPSWTYPGTKTVIIDNEHPMIVRSLPYQALIGRLCGASGCGEPFLVGSERIVCPNPSLSERLELWINHIIARSGDLQVPFADLTFQGRRGEYRFEVTNAPPGACGR
jgi:hypothetical protein